MTVETLAPLIRVNESGVFLSCHVQPGAKRTAVSFKLNYGVVYLMGPISNFIIIFYELAGLIECFTKGPRNYRDKGGDEE